MERLARAAEWHLHLNSSLTSAAMGLPLNQETSSRQRTPECSRMNLFSDGSRARPAVSTGSAATNHGRMTCRDHDLAPPDEELTSGACEARWPHGRLQKASSRRKCALRRASARGPMASPSAAAIRGPACRESRTLALHASMRSAVVGKHTTARGRSMHTGRAGCSGWLQSRPQESRPACPREWPTAAPELSAAARRSPCAHRTPTPRRSPAPTSAAPCSASGPGRRCGGRRS